jgi:SAM-dependent methyltransferase
MPETANGEFERLYLATRMKENRLYSDLQVKQLPFIEKTHVHFSEWQLRKRSFNRLLRYLTNKTTALRILEVGCGNGWLSARLAANQRFQVIGIDINKTEILQAEKLFGNRPNLFFKLTNLEDMNSAERFDIIVFAASVQYFPSLSDVMAKASQHLKQQGEIHILDSLFYYLPELEAARKRSTLYYQSIGHPDMQHFYFHHSVHSFNGFQYVYLYNPARFLNKVFHKKDLFPWLCLKPV